jgi:PAS domain S-box-containing protein
MKRKKITASGSQSLSKKSNYIFEKDFFFGDYFKNNKQVMLVVEYGTNKIVGVNNAAIGFYGFPENEFVQKTVLDLKLFLPEDFELIVLDAEKNKSGRFEIVTKLSSGDVRDVEVFISSFSSNDKLYLIITVNDISDYKKSLKALIQSENRFKAFSSATGEALFISYNGICIDANEAAGRMFGYKPEELIGIFAAEIFAPESQKLVKRNMLSGYEEPYEALAQHKNGTKFWVEIVGHMYDYNGKRTRITAVKNIDERVKIIKQLAENKANLEALIENNDDVIWSLDKEYRLLTFNSGFKRIFEKIFGLNVSHYYKVLSTDFFNEKLYEKWKSYYDRALQGERFTVSFSPLKKMDLVYEFAFNPIFDNKKIIGVSIFGRNVTERVKIEEALRESEENFRLLFESSPLGTYIAEPNGKINDVNQAALKILGSPSAEATKQINVITFPPLVKNGYAAAFSKCVETAQIQKFESRYLTKWAKDLYLSSYIVPLKNEKGKVVKVYTIMEDTTERNLAIQALKESEKKLKESNKTKDIFFSIIAHDLRSPFNTMLGFSKLLSDNYDDYSEEEKKKFINIIYTGIKDTFNLLENLLLWSRSQRGKIEFNPERINLFLLTNKMIKLLKQQANVKSITIYNKINEYYFVNADQNMLSTIIRNLLSNAVKFTGKGGVITLSSATSIKDGKNFIEVSVNDSGVGISEEAQSKLFVLSEIRSTRGTENEKGSGLGLILCKEFVEKHGGDIRVSSKEGKGSTFTFSIPAG